MNQLPTLQFKEQALETIKNFRVPDLQALLEYGRLSRQGNKRELLQRCNILISSSLTPQLANKIQQIHLGRINTVRSYPHPSTCLLIPSTPQNYPSRNSSLSSANPSNDNLPLPNLIQNVHLPFYDKLRTFECVNIPVNWRAFPPLRFILNDFDIDVITKRFARVFLRITPTIIDEVQHDVLPPYFLAQCNGQIIVNNNIGKTMGAPAHSITFPTDITDALILKSNVPNTLDYSWLHSPTTMSLKNLPRSYTLKVQLVRYVSLDYLIQNVVKRDQPLKQSNSVNINDKDIEIEENGLMTTRQSVSLICPITQALINVPVKSSLCSHLTCFDLRSFLQMNERRLQWTCPLCRKPAAFENLCVDKRLQAILSNVPPNCSAVELSSSSDKSDYQYIIDHVKHESTNNTSNSDHDDKDDEIENELVHHSPVKRSRLPSNSNECILLSSGSESEDEIESYQKNQTTNSSIPIISSTNNMFNKTSDFTNGRQQSHSKHEPYDHVHAAENSMPSNDDDENYWNELSKIAYGLIPNSKTNQTSSNRKRSCNSMLAISSYGDRDDPCKRPKRKFNNNKPQSTEIEVILISSSDSSDNEGDY